jgi:prostaglandin-E synthase 1
MSTLIADPQFKLYALCCVVLSLQMLLLAAMTAAKRAGRKNYLNPEDVKVSFKDARLVDGAEHPDVARVQRAHRNLNESLPMFFALGLVCVLAGAAPMPVRICLGTFTVARMIHSVVYINEIQPFRTISYAIGSFALIGMMVLIVMAALA